MPFGAVCRFSEALIVEWAKDKLSKGERVRAASGDADSDALRDARQRHPLSSPKIALHENYALRFPYYDLDNSLDHFIKNQMTISVDFVVTSML